VTRLLRFLDKFSDQIALVLDAKATELRERAAEHGMARYVEGYRDGYLKASIQAGLKVDADGKFVVDVTADNPYDDGISGFNRPPRL